MRFDRIIKGGTIYSGSGSYKGDIGIKDGKIDTIAAELPLEEGRGVIDAGGMYIFPGALDVHVHFQLPFCGTVSRDDFENGTKAAACGGVTTIVDYAIQKKGGALKEALEQRRGEADARVCIDYSLHGGITDWNRGTKEEMLELIEGGVPSFKMFMIYRKEGWMADDGMLYSALKEAGNAGGIIMVHAESAFILDLLVENFHIEREKWGAMGHVLSRPNFVEAEAIQRAIFWAEVTGGRLYIVHMSTAEGADLVEAAKGRGVRVHAETCPQYLLLDDGVFKGKNGHYFATCPQIKKKGDSERLWKGLYRGEVEVAATDTCTFDTKQKDMWEGDFTMIPFGLPGVETMVPLLFSEGVKKGRLGMERFVQLVCENPAKIFGLYPRKGALLPGSDADVVIYDPEKEWVLSWKDLQTACDWSPFEGWKIKGGPHLVLCRGEEVSKDGKFTGRTGFGRFLKRKPGLSEPGK